MPRLERDGATIHYESTGAGSPALVFVHGFTCSLADWAPQVAHFGPTRQVVCCDLRGHGASTAGPGECDVQAYGADVAALMRALDLPRAVLVGHSMGCRVVLQAALDASDRVAGVILVDGSWRGAAGTGARDLIRQVVEQAGGYREFVHGLFAQMFVAPSADAERITARALAMPEAIGRPLYENFTAWDAVHMRATLRRVGVPIMAIQSTTIAAGKRHAMKAGETSPWLDLLREQVPGARVEIVPDVGHFTMLDAPAATNRLIADFCRRIEEAH